MVLIRAARGCSMHRWRLLFAWLRAAGAYCRGLLVHVALALLLSATSLSSHAVCDPRAVCCNDPGGGAPCGGSSIASLGNGSGTNQGAGNPIHIITGNKYQQEVDLPALPGVMGLEIVRHYNSVHSGGYSRNGILGRGWKLSYETELFARGATLEIVQADGSAITFERLAEAAPHYRSANAAEGTVSVRRTSRGDEHVWLWPDGRQLSFDAGGKLVQIAAPSGEFVSLLRDTQGWLISVTDPQGRRLRLNYLERRSARVGRRFSGVQSIDSPVGRFRYSYGSEAAPPTADAASGSATSVDSTQALSNLVKVDLPTHHDAGQRVHEYADRGVSSSSVSRVYHYEDARFPTLLTGISVVGSGSDGKLMAQRIASYRYDSAGRGVLSVRGEPSRLPNPNHPGNESGAAATADSGIEQVMFDRSRPGETVVTNSLGQTTRYRHAQVADQPRLLEVLGAGCASCGPSNVRYGYDALGRLVSTMALDREGRPLHERRTVLDAQGRPVRIERIDHHAGKALPPQWLLRYEYGQASAGVPVTADTLPRHAAQPKLIARPSVIAGREHRLIIVYNASGQPLQLTEEGYSPIDEQGNERALGTPIKRSVRYGYRTVNGRSLLAQIDGPLVNGPSAAPGDSDIMRIEWDALGRFVGSVTAPGGFTRQMRYDEAGRLAAVQGADLIETRFRHDSRNQLVSVSISGPGRQQPAVQSYRYDALGRRVEAGIGEAGSQGYRGRARYGFDVADRQVWSASALGLLQRSQFDSEGKSIEHSLESASFRRSSRFDYDAFNRLIGVSDSAGGARRIVYDPDDLPRASIDSLGRETHYRYDPHRRPLELTVAANAIQASVQDTTLRFVRDATEVVTAVVATNGAATRSLRDDFGRIVATISGDSGRSTRRFDAADRLIVGSDANGNRAQYEYDAAGRIVRQEVIEAQAPGRRQPIVTTWRYEGMRLVAVDHAVQSERYRHDEQGRIASRTVLLKTAEGAMLTSITHYRYGVDGLLSAVSLPDGSVIEHRRNGQGQVVALARRRIGTSWLAWLLPAENIAQDIERDLVGLSRYRYGNGIEAEFRRSRSGVLAQVLHRSKRGASGALIDHRYLWDTEGNLLRDRGLDRTLQYAYDAQDRLIVATASGAMGDDGVMQDAAARGVHEAVGKEGGAPANRLVKAGVATNRAAIESLSHYFYDGVGNRLLSREAPSSTPLPDTETIRTRYAPNSNRWIGRDDDRVQHDRNGQPTRIGARDYVWDGLGKLSAVREDDRTLARYRYNHRGERVGKTVEAALDGAGQASGNSRSARAQTTHYLYDGRRLTAELNEDGKVVRQYVYLAEQPIAIIDTPTGVDLARAGRSAWQQIWIDLGRMVEARLATGQSLVYLHHNHLGAPELVTDSRGAPIWRTRYGAFGKALDTAAVGRHDEATGRPVFTLNLRLPGQYEDAETGLHYNDHRYYDPSRGQYLTPDPLGLHGGINGYAYAAGNPLKYVDPSGLILFAFDGTGNSASPGAGDTLSNVRKFYLAYDEELNGPKFYITGIGTTNENMPFRGSVLTGNGFDERVQLGFRFLEEFINGSDDTAVLDIDAIGFSRGAAEARVWVNLLVAARYQGAYTTKAGKSRCLHLRFEGLWDTVPHLGLINERESRYDFRIPAEMNYAAHAVALNEHRGGLANFNARSILDAPATSSGDNRNEMGFIGSHSDIGGSYGTGDLSNVALMWMIEQGRLQGIGFNEGRIADEAWNMVTNPIVHDKSGNKIDPSGAPLYDDRYVIYGSGTKSKQRAAVIGGNDTDWARSFVSYYSAWCGPRGSPVVGVVDMSLYDNWLRGQGINIAVAPVAPVAPAASQHPCN